MRRRYLSARERYLPRYRKLDDATGGAFSVLAQAIAAFSRQGASEAAAGMTFYVVFSLFPLLALAVTVTSLFVAEDQIAAFLVRVISPVFPVSRLLIDQNIERFVSQRGAISVIGALGLLWSASSGFATMVQNLNRAWENARMRNFVQRRLTGIYVIAAILALLALGLVFTTVFDLAASVEPEFMRAWFTSTGPQVAVLSQLLSMGITFAIFLVAYRYLPSTRVRLGEAFWGALLVAIAWKLTSSLFSLYLGSGLSRYDVLYGSIAALAVLMFWLYLNNNIILLGAHLCAAVARRSRARAATPAGPVVVPVTAEVEEEK